MAELGTRTLRVKLDTSVALPSNLDIASWRGNALDLEVGIFDSSTTVASITNVTSVNVKVQASQTDNTTLMDSTVAAASMDATLTADTWADGTAQHATFEFTNAQANLTITDSSYKYWIVFTALLDSGDTVTLAAGDFTLHEDNDTTAGDPDVNPGTAITLEEADARYATLAQGTLSEWQLKTTDFTAETNGSYIIAGAGITITAAATTEGDTFQVFHRSGDFTINLGGSAYGGTSTGSLTVCTYDGAAYVNKTYNDTTLTATATETLTNKTLTNPSVNNYTEGVVATGTVTTTHTFSLTSGTVQTVQLTASTACTFTMPTATAGKSFTCFLKQAAATGNGTATFTGVVWSGGTVPTITATAGQMDIISFVADGTNWYGSIIQDFTA